MLRYCTGDLVWSVLRRRYLDRVGIRGVLGWDPVAARQLLLTVVEDLQLGNV